MLNSCVYIVDETAPAASQTPSALEALAGPDLSTLITAVCLLVFNLCIAWFILREKKCKGCRIQARTMREQFKN